jgi:hypothetical protein
VLSDDIELYPSISTEKIYLNNEELMKKLLILVSIVPYLVYGMEPAVHPDICAYVATTQIIPSLYAQEQLYTARRALFTEKLAQIEGAEKEELKKRLYIAEYINERLAFCIEQEVRERRKRVTDIASYILPDCSITATLREELKHYNDRIETFVQEAFPKDIFKHIPLLEHNSGVLTSPALTFQFLLPSAMVPYSLCFSSTFLPLINEYATICEHYGLFLISPTMPYEDQKRLLHFLQERFKVLADALITHSISFATPLEAQVNRSYLSLIPKPIVQEKPVMKQKSHTLRSLRPRIGSLEKRARQLQY